MLMCNLKFLLLRVRQGSPFLNLLSWQLDRIGAKLRLLLNFEVKTELIALIQD
jgi:hypothetical protein